MSLNPTDRNQVDLVAFRTLPTISLSNRSALSLHPISPPYDEGDAPMPEMGGGANSEESGGGPGGVGWGGQWEWRGAVVGEVHGVDLGRDGWAWMYVVHPTP